MSRRIDARTRFAVVALAAAVLVSPAAAGVAEPGTALARKAAERSFTTADGTSRRLFDRAGVDPAQPQSRTATWPLTEILGPDDGDGTPEPEADAAPAPLGFEASGIHGGGMQNTIAVDPHGSGGMLVGGDVAGVHRSGSGAGWVAANSGLTIGGLAVAGLTYSPITPGKVYAALGQHGAGGLAVSNDGGSTWTTRSQAVRFSGVHGPTGKPVGNVLLSDPNGDFLYAATYDQGVMRSRDDGVTWDQLGLAGMQIRAIALDEDRPGRLFAATWQGSVYRTDTARSSGVFEALVAGPTAVEDLLVINGHVFAAGWNGVHRSHDGGTIWTTVHNDGALWSALAGGTTSTGGVVLYAGAGKPVRSIGKGYDSVIRSDNLGLTWRSMTADPTKVHRQIIGTGGQHWWLAEHNAAFLLGGASSLTLQLAVDPADPERVHVAGRGGVWSSFDGGSNWHPDVRDLGVSVVRSVISDPADPNAVFAPAADWALIGSGDGLSSVRQLPPSRTSAHSIALAPGSSPATVYLGTGDASSNVAGEVWSNPAPLSGGTWTSENLGVRTGGKRPLALAAGTVAGQTVLLAAVEEGGVWRKVGGTWSQVSGTAMAGKQRSRNASFAWAPDGSVVYLYDRASGVWRSTDAGVTWKQIWSKPSPWDLTGYLSIDPARPQDLYVSVGLDAVYRLSGAAKGTVGAGITPAKLGSFASPGAMAIAGDGTLYVAEVATGVPALLSSADRGATWQAVDDERYRAVAHFPTAIDIAADGTVRVALRGNGVVTGRR